MAATIKVSKRAGAGKGAARKLRAQGMVPGIIYGAVAEPINIALSLRELEFLLERGGGSGLIDLDFEDEKGAKAPMKALIRQVDYEPVKDSPIHIDFQSVALDKKVTISVSVEAVGTPIGVTLNKGLLSHVLYEVEIECLPTAIPRAITVDVSGLDIGQSFHVSDIPAMEGIRVLTPREYNLFSVEAPKAEVEEVKAAEAETAEPEVIAKKKEEEAGE